MWCVLSTGKECSSNFISLSFSLADHTYAVKVESSRRLEVEDPVVAGGHNFLVGGIKLNVQRTDFCVFDKKYHQNNDNIGCAVRWRPD